MDCLAWECPDADVRFKLTDEARGEKRADNALLANLALGEGFIENLMSLDAPVANTTINPIVDRVVQALKLSEEVVDFGFAGDLLELVCCHE